MSVTRRDLLYMLAAAGTSAIAAPLALGQAASSQPTQSTPASGRKQPNILFLLTDQHSPRVLGCYGNQIVKTPNLDRLAQRGVLFENVYAAAPLCVPSRTSLITGRTPSENHVWMNSDMLASNRPTFAHSLAVAGYETALIGRMHFLGPDQHHGFEKRIVGDVTMSFPGSGGLPLSPELVPGATEGSRRAVTTAGSGRTGYEAFDQDVTKAAIDYIRGSANSSRPFCAVVGFTLPHSPLVCSKEDWDYYYSRVNIPEVPPGYFEHLHPAVRQWRKDRGVTDLTEEEVRRGRAGYFGLVTEADRNIGRILDALSEAGLDDNTIVVYSSDHGEMAGDNGMWWKFNFYEGSVRVPLIISWPGQFPGNTRVSQVTSLTDVAPTLCDLGGAPELPHHSGRNLHPLLAGKKTEWTNVAFSELPAIKNVPTTRMVRKDDWKLVHFEGMRPQLFNLKTDPQEFHDLGEDPEYAGVREELLALALSNWSAAEIEREGTERREDEKLLAQWARKTRPNDLEAWKAPPGANVFPEDD